MAMSTTAATLSITQTVALYTVFLPELADVKSASPGRNPDFTNTVRYAELTAAATSVAIAGVVCLYERSWQPLFATLAIALLLTVAYEVALCSNGSVPNLISMTS